MLTASAGFFSKPTIDSKSVALLSFMANREQGRTVLTWVASHTQSEDVFIIERSRDGLNFTVIAIIKSEVNKNTYSLADTTESSQLYYRIRLRSLHGEIGFSNTIFVKSDNKTADDIRVFQNPAGREIVLQTNLQKAGKLLMSLTDMSGKPILQQTALVNEGVGNFAVLLPATISNGLYILQVKGNGFSKTIQVMLQR